MPEIQPFAAIRFDHTPSGGDLSALLAPPYDILDQSDKDALLARSPHNIVAVDLPHIPPKTAGSPEVYAEAARTLRAWLGDGTLIREEAPALYRYDQRFESGGVPLTRRKFIARVRLAPFSEGSVLPHERTFGGPKEDRLALMKATRCQLSPIFGLYTDPEDRIDEAFGTTASRAPDAVGTLDGVESRVWIVRDSEAIRNVVATMAGKKIYIADGHHRYGTALLYRDWLTQQQGGALSDDHPANYVMFVLASMDDPGCVILPYNRAIAGIDLDTLVTAWHGGTEPVDGGEGDVTLFEGSTGREVSLRFSDRAKLAALEPDAVAPWYELDYAYLHRYLIDDLLAAALPRPPQVRYVKSIEQAKSTAKEAHGVALLVKATPMAQLRAVSEAGGLMPQKSTYFHPKLATGITIHALE